MKTCETCIWRDEQYQECHRYPPVVERAGFMRRWPLVKGSDYCGEYSSKENIRVS